MVAALDAAKCAMLCNHIGLNLLLFKPTGAREDKFTPLSLCDSLSNIWKWLACHLFNCLFSGHTTPRILFLTGFLFRIIIIIVSFLWICSSLAKSFLNYSAQNRTEHFRWSLTTAEYCYFITWSGHYISVDTALVYISLFSHHIRLLTHV